MTTINQNVIRPISYVKYLKNQGMWTTNKSTILEYSNCSNFTSVKAVVNILRNKQQDEILNNFKIFKDLKILEEIEGYSTYEKYYLLDVSGVRLGIVYLADSFPNIYEIRKIKHNLDYLADTWREEYGMPSPFIFNLHSDNLEILLIVYELYNMQSLKSQQDLNRLHEYENHFLIKNLSGKDVVMFCGKPIIINPEKVLLRDPKSKDLQQKLQFRYVNGNIETTDGTPEEVKKEIDKLETRQMLEIIGNNNI